MVSALIMWSRRVWVLVPGETLLLASLKSRQMALMVFERKDGASVAESCDGQLAAECLAEYLWRVCGALECDERCVCVEGCVMLGGPGGC